MATIEDFEKLEIKIGKVLSAESPEKEVPPGSIIK